MASFRLSAFADEAGADVRAQIAALKRNHIGRVELRGVDGVNVAQLSDAQAREAAARFADEGITLSSMGSPYGKYAIDKPFQPHLDDFRRGLELCPLLGAARIRMFSFFMPEGRDPAEYRDEVFERLDRMIELADAAGVQLLHENEKGIYGDTDERCLDLAKVFEGRMGVIYDPANFAQCGVSPDTAFPLLESRITYMHIKDALLATGAVVPSGKGDGGVARILASLAPRAQDMTLTLEPHLSVFKGLSGLQAEQVRHEYSYPSADAAFDAAADALKSILTDIGFAEGENGQWIR